MQIYQWPRFWGLGMAAFPNPEVQSESYFAPLETTWSMEAVVQILTRSHPVEHGAFVFKQANGGWEFGLSQKPVVSATT